MKKVWYILVLFLFTLSCIDPFPLQTGNQSDNLVVDGLVTNRADQSVVRLSRSLSFDNTQLVAGYIVPERDATVILKNDLGEEEILAEAEPGVYKPLPGFSGTVGTSYSIYIQTSDGKQYQSFTETMPDVPAIGGLLYEYYSYEELIKNISGNWVAERRFGFRIMVQVDDPDDERNYYRWKARGIFEFFSFVGETFLQCWAPVARLESTVQVMDDAYTNGNTFIEAIAVIPYDRPTYYQVTVQQQALTREAFEFWSKVKDQQTNTGSIFDPIPSQIKGNIYNIDDPDEIVLGFFGASSMVEETVLINRFPASGFVSPSPNILPQEGNCLDHEPNATNIKPPGFP
ncbi:MAG: DUF4249 domain-containing protein [Cyclobacteriaceae bacterium]|nr:DUF4249 domain-containing protein [Cyclobacteriaceae bacterium]